MGFDSLLDILRKAQRRHPGFAKRLGEAEALGRWDVAVGPAIAKHTRAIRVQEGVLWVEVDHPIWKSELHHRKHQILELLNSGRGESLAPAKDPVKDIFFADKRAQR